MRLWRYIKTLLQAGTLFSFLFPLGTVVLTWDANTEADLAGYRVYYGTSSRNYTQVIDVGKVTSYTLNQLQENQPYFFAVTAYDTAGNESGYSNEVSVIFNPPAEPEQPAEPVEAAYNYPNPFSPESEVTHLRYYLPQPDEVLIEIYDVAENLVRTLLPTTVKAAGEHTEEVWDGRDEQGRRVANGVYFCKIQTSRWTQFIKIAVSGK